MKTLNEYLKENKLKENDFRIIVMGIQNAHNTLETIDFDFEKVNYEGTKESLGFTTKAGDYDFHYELSKFLIRLLRFTDVNDDKALPLAYSLFVRSSKDGYKLKDLIEILEAKKVA